MLQITDLTHLNWTIDPHNTLGSAGSYIKAEDADITPKRYYKLSRYDDFMHCCIGYESCFEVIAYRFAHLLGITTLKYTPVHARVRVVEKSGYVAIFDTLVCCSLEFRDKTERKLVIEEAYANTHFNGEGTVDWCRRMGYSDYLNTLLLFDFLIYNRDRHGANIEYAVSAKSRRLIPLFDNGFSMLATCVTPESISHFDVMSDNPVNNFVGSQSLYTNLGFITQPIVTNKLFPSWKSVLFRDLKPFMPDTLQDKVWELLSRRYEYAKQKGFLVERP